MLLREATRARKQAARSERRVLALDRKLELVLKVASRGREWQ